MSKPILFARYTAFRQHPDGDEYNYTKTVQLHTMQDLKYAKTECDVEYFIAESVSEADVEEMLKQG